VPCAFCGAGSRLTKEHVFPTWLDAYLPGDRPYWVLEQDRFVGDHPFEVRRPSQGLDFVVKAVCGDCNNGWMSAPEEEAKPILERLLISTKLGPLLKDEQQVIARWATKTAMMLDFTQEKQLVPQADRTRFYKRGSIPRRAWIWLGGCAQRLPLTMSHTMRTEMERIDGGGERFLGFYAPIKIGHLIIYWVLPGKMVRIGLRKGWHQATWKIWPRPTDILFPPPMLLTDGEAFDKYVDQFWFDLLIEDAA
jgi:hypothetical protein